MNERTLVRCGFCNKQDSNLMLCGACKLVRYCNLEHQRNHWRTHKPECQLKQKKDTTTKSKKSKQHLAKRKSSTNGSGNAFTLDQSLLDSVISNQLYSNGSSNQEPILSTPIDSTMGMDDSGLSTGSRSLYQLKLTPDNYSWFDLDTLSDMTECVLRDLNAYGFCAVNDFLGEEKALQVLSEVEKLHSLGVLRDGQVVSQQVQAQDMGMIRGDKITWISGSEPGCQAIRRLVSTIDSVLVTANKHPEAGKLADYSITLRTRAMVACYPGNDTRYVKHIDNADGDGRCITAIYYLNKTWQKEDGGILRIYPEALGKKVADIEPIFDRMLFFWSDRRNPHEVLPSSSTRYAITVWYLDQLERDQYRGRNCSSKP